MTTRLLVLALALVACKSPPASDVAAPPAAAHRPAATGPSIRVETWWPGVSAANMAASIATPLERLFGKLPNLEHMASRSRRGETTIRLDFAPRATLDRAASDVAAAISAASAFLPKALPSPPIYMKVGRDPAVMRVELSSDTLPLDEVGVQAEDIVAQKLSQVTGVGRVSVCGVGEREWRVIVDPQTLAAMGKTIDDVVAEVGEVKTPSFGSDVGVFSIDKLPLTHLVATLEHGSAVPDCVAYDGERPVVVVTVQAQPGADRAETRARLDEVIPAIQKQTSHAILGMVLPMKPADDDELTASDGAQLQRIDDARYVAAHARALVEAGVDRDGDRSPETIIVHGPSLHAELARAALDRRLVLHDRDELVVGFESADPAALNDAVARHVAALTAANLPVRGVVGGGEAAERTFEVDHDTLAWLGVADDSKVATALEAMQPEGIVAGSVITQLTMERIVVIVHEPELSQLYVRTTSGSFVPLAAFVKVTAAPGPAEIRHLGQFPWIGIRVGGSRGALDAALALIPVAAGVHRTVAN